MFGIKSGYCKMQCYIANRLQSWYGILHSEAVQPEERDAYQVFFFFEFPLMIYDEKTDVSGVISKFLVVDCVMHLSPGHCQAACSQRLEILPTLWLTRLTSGPAG